MQPVLSIGLSALNGDWNPWLTMISVQGGAGDAVLGFLGHLGLTFYFPGVDTRLCYFRGIVDVDHHFNHFNSSEHLFVDT